MPGDGGAMGDVEWTSAACAVAEAACLVVLVAALVVAAATDVARCVVPNGCVAAVAAAGAVRAALGAAAGGGLAVAGEAALGATAVLAVMLAAAWASARRSGEPGVGGGDVKLLAALGVWAGPAGGLAVVALSCALGVLGWAAARGLGVLLGREGGRGGGIRMGPAIALAALLVLGACGAAVA